MNLGTFLRRVFKRRTSERELDRELQFHLEQQTAEHMRAGLGEREAREAALRDFGSVTRVQEECRDSWGVRFLDNLKQDAGYGLRGIRRNPGFAAIVILTLALGIGANTAIFSVVQGVLLRPLPFAEPARLVQLNQAAPAAGQPSLGFSVPDFTDFRERSRAFAGLAEYHQMWFILLGRPEPERVQTGVVSDNYFDLLGVKPLHGRTFLPGEDAPGAPAVLVLSHDYWMSSFGGDPRVVGQVFEMNNRQHTVVGVLPPLPDFPGADQVYMPASACPFRGAETMITNRQGRIIANVFARIGEGVSAEQAIDDARRVGIELCGAFPQDYPVDGGYKVEMQGIAAAFTGNTRGPLLLLLATSGFVLLIACANVANLALARLVRRDREFAVRAEMGAGRRRIIRQLVTENLLLAFLGGTAGLALAAAGVRMLVRYSSQFLPRADEIAIDGTVLLFTFALSIATGLLFGSRPSLPAGDRLAETLKDGARGTGGVRNRLRSLLVVSQVAVSVPLLVGAGLSVRSLMNLSAVDPGLDTGRTLVANLSLNWSRYDNFEKRFGYWERAMQNAADISGVESVGMSGVQPLNGLVNFAQPFQIDGRPLEPGAPPPSATLLVSSEDFFRTVGQPMLRGRAFEPLDTAEKPRVVIINQSLASRLWPRVDPVGQRVTFDNGTTWREIVGVVSNTRQQIDSEPVDEIHLPLRQTNGLISGTIVVRTRGAPEAFTGPLRAALLRADPQQPITSIQTLESVRDASIASYRLIATLLALFAALALVITSAGIGGVLAFTVSQRTPEIGIRMALGASRTSVLAMILGQGMRLVGLGLSIGIIAAFFLSSLMSGVLFNVPPTDPLTFVAVTVVLIVVAAASCLLPARRATSINPIVALRAN